MLQNRAQERCHQTGSRGPLGGDWFQEANKDSLVCALIECLIFLAVEMCSYCLGFFFSRNLTECPGPTNFQGRNQISASCWGSAVSRALLLPKQLCAPWFSCPRQAPGMWPAPNFIFSSGLLGEKRVLPETHERGFSVHSHTSSLPLGLLPSSQALP